MKFLAQWFFRATMLPVVQLLYRVRRTGVGFVPREGGVLLLSNHVSYLDSFIIYLTSPRPVRFVVLDHYVNKVKSIGWFLKLFGAIPIRPQHAKEAISRTVDALNEGDVVCLFPEGSLSRTGVLGELKKGFQLIARKADCPVVPVYMDGLWGSIFSFERGRYFRKRPNGCTCPLQVAFGRPIPGKEATPESVKQGIQEASIEAFSKRRSLDEPIEKALIRGLKRKRRQPFLVEYAKSGPRVWTRGYTLGLATAMARRWMNDSPDQSESGRIGILLPPGPMTVVINYGLTLAGKIPVNLPFTIDQRETEAVARAIAPLGIRTVITSRAFMSHLTDFWHGDEGTFIDLKSVVTGSGPGITLMERIRAFIEPTWLTSWRLDLKEHMNDREAVGLVRRPGDDPVLLNASQLHRNALQVCSANFVQQDEVVFSEQSLSSPGGLTIGCWSPAFSKGRVVSRSFSLQEDFDTMERAILDQGATIVVGTARFFSSIDKPLIINSLRYGIIFGRANQWNLEDWEETLDIPLARAWDLDGRVVSMSRTDPNIEERPRHAVQIGRLPKSVGRLLPGIAAKLEDGQMFLRFEPVGHPTRGPESSKVWLEGPREAEIDAEGFLILRNAD
ncbi:1-acyl-sn-glycerol-3-phosphate acyltransferase [Verrucomicrobiales bacterium]|nr:1-acyl-sn-glycerol-3-phosphate acyltransferase [Verrucomicrobiales bacterium]MDC0262946.1 1-acyl-sn-glycerol-3-phosphate acyltransferase [Verrucomicrobiales bacterium]MDC3353013.1 1-acyl-sn-glycerol-3-phosphate acyltransferase [Verrucomicrobiales bacterium]